ncbi:MAG: hypothetical protein AB7O45_02760 [Alphaproteobacteria bacterium]
MAGENQAPAAGPAPQDSFSQEIDQQLAAAEAAAAAEATTTQQPTVEQPGVVQVVQAETQQAAPAQQDPAQAEPARPALPETVPYARFAEVNAKRGNAEQRLQAALEAGNRSSGEIAALREQVARLTGQLEGMHRGGIAAPAQQQQQVDPVAQAEQELVALAERYEGGGMSATAYEKERLPLARKHARAIAQAEATGIARQHAQAQPKQGGDDLYLTDQTRALEDANPWIRTMPNSLIEGLKPMAIEYAKAHGIRLTDDAVGNRNLRAAFINVARELGLDIRFGAQPRGNPADLPPLQSTPAPAARVPVPANQPPPMPQRSAPSTGQGSLTESQFLAMSVEDRMALLDKAPHVFDDFAPG